MKCFLLTVAYHGAGFHGFQIQKSGMRTVAGELLAALGPLCKGELELRGASRTDAGVHALGQAVQLRGATRLDAATLLRALNAVLPRDLRVLAVREPPEGFDVRNGAEQKWYRYRVLSRKTGSPLEEATSWHIPEALDLEAVRAAAKHLVGEHDFAAFAGKADHPKYRRPDTHRRVDAIVVRASGPFVWFDVLGPAFLYRMVRNLVGTLVDVGLGRREPDSVRATLASGNRAEAGPCAPAQGLFLMGVRYPGEPVFDLEAWPGNVLEGSVQDLE